MLLPKYTIRQLLIGMVGVALVCMVLGFAARGNVVAHGMGLAIVGLFVPVAIYAAVYWTVLAFSKALPGGQTPEAMTERTTLTSSSNPLSNPSVHPSRDQPDATPNSESSKSQSST